MPMRILGQRRWTPECHDQHLAYQSWHFAWSLIWSRQASLSYDPRHVGLLAISANIMDLPSGELRVTLRFDTPGSVSELSKRVSTCPFPKHWLPSARKTSKTVVTIMRINDVWCVHNVVAIVYMLYEIYTGAPTLLYSIFTLWIKRGFCTFCSAKNDDCISTGFSTPKNGSLLAILRALGVGTGVVTVKSMLKSKFSSPLLLQRGTLLSPLLQGTTGVCTTACFGAKKLPALFHIMISAGNWLTLRLVKGPAGICQSVNIFLGINAS